MRIRTLVTCFFVLFFTFSFAQTDTTYIKNGGLSYEECSKKVDVFLIKLKRKPYYSLGGLTLEFKKTTFDDLKNKVLEHYKKFPEGEVIITTKRGAKYKNLVLLLDMLSKIKGLKYALM
jgi:biopolymer transport protein ExbD